MFTIKQRTFQYLETLADRDKNEIFYDRCEFIGMVLDTQSFTKCKFRACRFTACKITNTTFRECHFDLCEIRGVTLDRSQFLSCEFTNVMLEGVGLKNAFSSNSLFDGCIFDATNLAEARYYLVTMKKCRFSGLRFAQLLQTPGLDIQQNSSDPVLWVD